MERYGRLAGAGATRDEQDARKFGTDRFVLFALNRRDDVAHATRAMPIQCRKEGAFTSDSKASGLGRIRVEDLIVDVDDFAAFARDEMPTANNVHLCDGGCSIEGFRDGSAPIDNERRVFGIVDREPPDVPSCRVALGLDQIESAKYQWLFTNIKLGQSAQGHFNGDVAF